MSKIVKSKHSCNCKCEWCFDDLQTINTKLTEELAKNTAARTKIMKGDVIPPPLTLSKMFYLSEPKYAYIYGWEIAIIECGEILAQKVTK